MTVWIPQLFYDVLGRIVPGSILLLWFATPFALYWEGYAATRLSLQCHLIGFGVTKYGVAVVASYITGSLLGSLWKEMDRRVARGRLEGNHFLREYNDAWKRLLKAKQTTSPKLPVRLAGHMYDAIHLSFPKAGARLAKLRAEQYQAGALTAGFAALGIVLPALGVLAQLPIMAIVLSSVISFGMAFTSYQFLRYILTRVSYGIVSLWVLRENKRTEH